MDLPSLRRELDRFDPGLPVEAASTPPSSWYVSPDVAALERRAVFDRSWQAVARADELAEPGSFVAGRFAHRPWLITRDEHGVLRAFHNVCRHKAAAVAAGSGRATALACPYHGWSYGLDGGLRAAPRTAGMADFDLADWSLHPLDVAEWGPLVLVAGARGTPPPAGRWPGLSRRLAELRWDRLRWSGRRRWTLDCNWKVFCDNYLDGGYHVSRLHPELAGQLDLSRYATEVADDHSVQTAPPSARGRDGRAAGGALYAFVHPNLMINRYGAALDVNLVWPLGPGRCEVVFDFWFEETANAAGPSVEASLRDSERVQQQDVDVCEAVQVGLASGAWERGRYAPVEAAAHAFHRRLSAELRAALDAEAGGRGA